MMTRRHGCGFTLIETLISCALIAMLIGLLLPALGDVRRASRRAVSTANLRSHAQIFAAYTGDWKDTYPYFTTATATSSVVRNPARDIAWVVPFFGAHLSWHIALADGYYEGDHTSRAFRPPSRGDVSPGYTAYWYPCAFIASPAFWRPETREGPHQRGPTRVDQVLFSSSKALLVESDVVVPNEHVQLRPRINAACTDGSAADRDSALTHGTAYGGADGPWQGAMHGAWWPPVHHTIGGVAGRDFR